MLRLLGVSVLAACAVAAQFLPAGWDAPIPSFLHGDWLPLNTSEALYYHTLYEVCMAKTNRRDETCNQYKTPTDAAMATCGIHSTGLGHINGFCPNAHHLYRHKSTKPYPEGANMLSVMETIIKHGSNTLVLVGDSVTAQSFVNAYCELLRYGLSVEYINYAPNDQMLLLVHDPDPASPNKMFQILFKTYVRDQNQNFDVVTKTIDLLLTAGLFDKHESLPVRGPLVFLVNSGLHFNQDTDSPDANTAAYVATLERLTAYFLALVQEKNHIVLYRETTAQHFSTLDGRFHTNSRSEPLFPTQVAVDNAQRVQTLAARAFAPQVASQPLETQFPEFEDCRPLVSAQAMQRQNWRNRVMVEVLARMDPGGLIPVVPFYEVTAARHDLHLGRTDCTHFCHMPTVWIPLWASVHHTLQHHIFARKTSP